MNNILMTFPSRFRKYAQVSFLKTRISCSLLHRQNLEKRTHAHSVFVWAFPDRSPRIHHRSELTERDWENPVQALRQRESNSVVLVADSVKTKASNLRVWFGICYISSIFFDEMNFYILFWLLVVIL